MERLTAALGEGGVLTHKVDRDELTIVVAPERWIDAALHLRDAEGYDYLSDVVTADWLHYGGEVAGYWGTERVRRPRHEPQRARGATRPCRSRSATSASASPATSSS